MKQNIILFGSTGMLGNYILKIFQNKYNIISILRSNYDIIENDYTKLLKLIKSYKSSIIINCAGIIPQRSKDENYSFFIINSLFPKMLEKISIQLGVKLIHISSNCVFNYENGNSNELTMPNETNPYGLSKILGEPENACVIRTSIIGEEIVNKKSFLEWVLSNKEGEINGYSNYYWNGITCYTLVNYIKNIVENNLYWNGVKHIHSKDTISKYEMAKIINDVYNLNIKINPINLDITINKTLSSIYDNTIINKSIKEQIIEQKEINLIKNTIKY